MLALNGSARLIYRLFGGFGPFHVAAVFSLGTVVAGVASAVRRRPEWVRRHYAWMTWSYVGLCAAAVSEVGTRVPAFHFWWAVLLGTAAVFAIGGVMIRRSAASVLAPFQRRVRPAAPVAE
jgi:peptidoglycan/LPS O-acetylase OafA/YrhL